MAMSRDNFICHTMEIIYTEHIHMHVDMYIEICIWRLCISQHWHTVSRDQSFCQTSHIAPSSTAKNYTTQNAKRQG